MDWITFLNAAYACNLYSYFNLETKEMRQLDGEGRVILFARSCDGNTDYYSVLSQKYTLRDNMARRLRSRYYKRDRDTGEETELFTSWEIAGQFQFGNILLLRDGRFLIVVIADRTDNRLFLVDETGKDARELWRTHSYPYGFAISPDEKTVAYHLAWKDAEFNPYGEYAINLTDLQGNRKLVCSEEGHLFFGPRWSLDGRHIVFQDCLTEDDPGHHFADLMICEADGSNVRRLTSGRPLYFGTSHGLPGNRMGGSNCPVWLDNTHLILSIRSPGAHPDCHFDGSQRDHEELIYDPSMGQGGCHLVLYDIETGSKRDLTPLTDGQWDFRAAPDGEGRILFTRSRFGEAPEIRLLDPAAGEDAFVTRGMEEKGADYPAFCRFVPDFDRS